MLSQFSNLYEEIKQLLDPGIALIIGILTILATRNSNKVEAAKDRLKLAYHPLFLSIEPHLYKKVNMSDITDFLDVFDEIDRQHSLLIYPSLRYWVKLIKSNNKNADISEDTWFSVCDYINKDYDILCRTAFMPMRSTAYRLNKHQYKNKFLMYIGYLRLFIAPLLFITALLGILNPAFVSLFYAIILYVLLIQFIESLH